MSVSEVPTAQVIGLPHTVAQFAHLSDGLVLFTGPTGCGKSTTLATVVGIVLETSPRHVVTLEDPIVYSFSHTGEGMVSQRQRGETFVTFPSGIREALHQDPDVLVVDEIRDADTVRAILDAAQSGCLVLGTMHTFGVTATVAHILSLFDVSEQDEVRQQLALVLRGCTSQLLLPAAGGFGRTAAFETLTWTPEVAQHIRRLGGENMFGELAKNTPESAVTSIEHVLATLVVSGTVDLPDARRAVRDVASFDQLVETL